MIRVVQLLGWPQFKVKRSFLGVLAQNDAIFHVFCDFFRFLFDSSLVEVFKS